MQQYYTNINVKLFSNKRKIIEMRKKNTRNTKGRIVNAAWRLFYEQGYEDTTVEEIIEESGTSKGSFYHYFEGKDALLSSLSFLLDEKYNTLQDSMDSEMNSYDKLLYLNQELFDMIENSISMELLARLLSSQLITHGNVHLLDHNRMYYRLLRKIVSEGQAKGELITSVTVNDIVKTYAMMERALMYDWCLCNGEYSLKNYSSQMLPMILKNYKIETEPSAKNLK